MENDDRAGNGPWKWELIDRLDRLIALIERRESRSKAGKASAEARRKKFGTAIPSGPAALVVGKLDLPEDLGQGILELVPQDPPKKKKYVREHKSKILTYGAVIFQSYAAAYYKRYGVQPIRNAKVNSQCSQIAKQVGVATAVFLVTYYVSRNDMNYVKSSHPIGLCLLDLQKLATQFETNNVVTHKDAQRAELEDANDRAVKQYLTQQNPVHEREVENADS